MIYFTTNSDGNKTEGIGAMSQYQIICYVLSQLYNVNFYFTGFKNLTHYQPYNITPEQWDLDITNFFNLPLSKKINFPVLNFHELNNDLETFINTNSNCIINFEPSYLMSFIDQHIDTHDVLEILKNLGNNIILPNDLKYYFSNKTNVAIHIRKFNSVDQDLNPRREFFNKNKHEFYKHLIKTIHDVSPENDVEYHVFSQGKEEDYHFLKHPDYNIVFHIEEHPLVSLYHMMKSDIFVTANSSLSYVAHLLGTHKKCFVQNNFFHNWKSTSTLINYENRNN